MKKSEWNRLANHLWKHAVNLEGGKMSLLIKELVIKCNMNMEMIENDNEEFSKIIGVHRRTNTNTTSSENYNGTDTLSR